MESKFADLEFARQTYESVVWRTLNSGVWPSAVVISLSHAFGRQQPAAITAPCILKLRRCWRMSFRNVVRKKTRAMLAQQTFHFALLGQRAFVGVGEFIAATSAEPLNLACRNVTWTETLATM